MIQEKQTVFIRRLLSVDIAPVQLTMDDAHEYLQRAITCDDAGLKQLRSELIALGAIDKAPKVIPESERKDSQGLTWEDYENILGMAQEEAEKAAEAIPHTDRQCLALIRFSAKSRGKNRFISWVRDEAGIVEKGGFLKGTMPIRGYSYGQANAFVDTFRSVVESLVDITVETEVVI